MRNGRLLFLLGWGWVQDVYSMPYGRCSSINLCFFLFFFSCCVLIDLHLSSGSPRSKLGEWWQCWHCLLSWSVKSNSGKLDEGICITKPTQRQGITEETFLDKTILVFLNCFSNISKFSDGFCQKLLSFPFTPPCFLSYLSLLNFTSLCTLSWHYPLGMVCC